MRLINLKTYVIKEFMDHERPPYVILSHTWGAEEVSLQKLEAGGVEHMEGYRKIVDFCRQGAAHGFEWGWVDTCCIDKTSSAELSEAINSMYKWYREADVCYVFLPDVQFNGAQPHLMDEEFAKSRWFTRGWTLQELLAPSSVVFYLRDWVEYGTKATRKETITKITGIPQLALSNKKELFSVAHRMSWVANRQTTRIEDISYCLLGLFEVNMPLLYGEGEGAFKRLQEEIMKVGVDLSILAWPNKATQQIIGSFVPSISCLAASPSVFKDFRDTLSLNYDCGPYSLTNKGLRIENLPLLKFSAAKAAFTSAGYTESGLDEPSVFALLCYIRKGPKGHKVNTSSSRTVLGIVLDQSGGRYYRPASRNSLLEIHDALIKTSTLETCYISTDTYHDSTNSVIDKREVGLIRTFSKSLSGFSLSSIHLGDVKERDGNLAFILNRLATPRWPIGDTTSAGLFFSNYSTMESFAVIVGIRKGQEWVDVIVGCKAGNLSELANVWEPPRHPVPVDRMSKPLREGKEVFVSISRGVKRGERVFFLDISTRESRQTV